MKYTIVLILLFTDTLTSAQSIKRWSAEKKEKMDSFFRIMEANDRFNGSVLIAEHGEIVYQRSAGYWSTEQKIPNSSSTPFNLASVSKPFTSLAVLQLVEKKKIKVDDHYVKYIKDFPYPTVTIRHLLNHTAGLPALERFESAYISANPNEIISNEKVYSHLLELNGQSNFTPGENMQYNNLNYILLAKLVETVSGLPFGEYMKKNIFTPAGMIQTSVRNVDSPNTPRYIYPSFYESLLKNVDSLDHGKVHTYYNLGGTYGPGNLVSTMNDLFNFDRALFSGKLLKRSLLDTATSPIILNNGQIFYMGKSNRSYGMGWNIMEDSTGKYIFHDGHIVGITAMFYKNITRDQTIIFYDNTDAPYFFQKIGTASRIMNDLPLNKIPVTRSLARVYGEALVKQGPDFAISLFNSLRQDTAHYYMDELEMNSLGLQLISASNIPDHGILAMEVLKINTLLYPKSANTYDSYAEALSKNGKKKQAILMYEKSILLNPNNKDGINALKKLKDTSP